MPPNSTRQTRQTSRRFSARVVLGVVTSFAGCNVYDSQLISTAFGTGGTPSVGGAGGSSAGAAGRGGGTGGTAGIPYTGGSAGAGGATGGAGGGGSTGDGGTSGMEGGTDGDGGEDPGVGGTAGAGAGGQGGAAAGLGGGGAGGKGGAGAGGVAGAGAGGVAGAGAGGAGAGGAGAGGAGAGGAGAGGAGAGGAGAGGAGGMGETCPGCARLSAPLTATANKVHFTLLLPAATDLSAATITFRVAKRAGTGGTFRGYIQEGSPDYRLQDGASTTIASIGTGMQDIAWSIASAGTAANKTIIRRIGIEIVGTGGSSWTNPTVLYVDSIIVTGSSLNPASYPFDTEAAVYTTPTEQGPTGRMFLNSYADDTNVMGAAISWLGP